MSGSPDSSRLALALHLGDNCLVLAQQLSAWCGHGPALEEDLAVTNTALDLIGQARMWLDLAGRLEGAGRDADRLAYFRDVREFRNCLLVEQENGDFAATLMRQYLFDQWQHLALDMLARSADADFTSIAARAAKEVRYHLERSARWVQILGDGTAESRRRTVAALEALWPYTGELLETADSDQLLEAEGIRFEPASLADAWRQAVGRTLRAATLEPPSVAYMQTGGRRGLHGERLGYLLTEMQSLPRAHPDAVW